MKTKLIILILFILLLSLGFGVNYFLSLKKVNFVLEDYVTQITIYASNGKELSHLSSSDTVSLKSGEYYFTPEGKDILTDKIPFSVKDENITVTVNPPYSDDYLEERLQTEYPLVKVAISSKYKNVFNNYRLEQGRLYGQGEWFGGLLVPIVSHVADYKDPYRVVLHKEDGKWKVIRRPEYILTSNRYKEVPIEILREINSIVGEQGS